MKKNNQIKIGFAIWLELEKLGKQLDELNSKQFQEVIDLAIKRWVSYDWLIEFLNNSRSLENAINDLKELSKK